MNRARLVLIALSAAAIAQLAWYVPRMPPLMATHFDGAGSPNGWMTRGAAAAFHLAVLGVAALAFIGLPILLGRMAPTRINIPNRQYWLAPERQAATVAALQRWMAALGCGVVLLLMAVSGLSFEANLNPPARLPTAPFLACLGAFLIYVVGAMIALYRRFPKPPPASL